MGKRGKDLETAEDVLKAVMTLTVSRIITASKKIIQTVNEIRVREKRTAISERSIRKAMALLVESGSLRRRTITFDNILDNDDNIIEKNVTRVGLYEIDGAEATMRMIGLRMTRFKREISRLPSDLQDELIEARHHTLTEYAVNNELEMLSLIKIANSRNADSKDPTVRLVRDYYARRTLKDIMEYLKAWSH